MKLDSLGSVVAVAVAIGWSANLGHAQCLSWDPQFGHFEVESTSSFPSLYAQIVFDDGSGPALYVAGFFSSVDGVAAQNVARWNGTQWSALGTGLSLRVESLAVFDDGGGAALYAGGKFPGTIAKWDGSAWIALGSGFTELNVGITAMIAHDDGSGPALFVSGDFETADGTSAIGIAKWNGSVWSALGSGLTHNGFAGIANEFRLFDDGSGPVLLAGGHFDMADGVSVNDVAKWDGSTWSAFGSGVDGPVYGFTEFDDGSGSALYACGSFTTAGGSSALGVAKWNGVDWAPLACGFTRDGGSDALMQDLAVYDDGSGSALYAGGVFNAACGSSAIFVARWTGSSWVPVGAPHADPVGGVVEFAVFDDGSGRGPRLWAAGIGDPGEAHVRMLAGWDGTEWTGPTRVGHGVDGTISALASFDDGTGPALFAGGDFASSSEAATRHVGKWDGDRWSALGDGLDAPVRALTVFDDGGGADLYAGGEFTSTTGLLLKRVARWDGSTWSSLGAGMNGSVYALTVADLGSGPALYAGGFFSLAGGAAAGSIAKWNGSSWSALGSGINGTVYALTVFDDGLGAGPRLIAGGEFTSAGGTASTRISRWNGTNWTTLGTGMNGPVYSLEVFDEGAGPRLFVGGFFLVANGVNAFRIARWNGFAFSSVGASGVNGAVNALHVFDDGAGPKLYAAGNFAAASGLTVNRIATWDGANWASLDGGVGLNAEARALAISDDASAEGPAVFVGGDFTSAGGVRSTRIARFGSCRPGVSYCAGDGLDPFLAAECPCGNNGDPGHGCANSNAVLGGARLSASGTTSPNTIVFTCTGVPNNTLCTFLRAGSSLAAGFVFGDGVKCLNGTGVRFGQQNSGQGGNPSNTAIATTATVPTGNTRYYQLHYRNPNAGFCPPESFNISNGYAVAW